MIHKLSQIFRPFNLPPKNSKIIKFSRKPNETASKGYKLLCQYGFIRQFAPGMYSILPMGQRIIEKLKKLLDRRMTSIGAHKMSLPFLSKQSQWIEAGTYEKSKDELYQLKDRKGEHFVLNPTHEQSFSHLISTEIMSYRDFPKLLYQIGPKFRDEMQPKLGLLRSKEFLMKDLYSFDIGPKEAKETYETVTNTYKNILKDLGIKYLRVESRTESGFESAHEYFYESEVGDDKVYSCRSCEKTYHVSTIAGRKSCPECSLYVTEEGYSNAIEIAHTFLFGTSFSERLGSCFVDLNCKRAPLHLCSYGIGVSRLLSACADVLATDDGELRWPIYITPYTLCIIPPKAGSKEENELKFLFSDYYRMIDGIPTLHNDIIIDDRTEFTIGRRFMEARLMGFSYVLIIGKEAVESPPLFEIYDIRNMKKYLMPLTALIQYLIHETEILSDMPTKTAYIADSSAS